MRHTTTKKLRLADLVEDPSFINWVRGVNREVANKWEGYLPQNPHQQSLIENAALIVRGIPFAPKHLHPQVVEQQWRQLQKQLLTPEPTQQVKPVSIYVRNYQYVTVSFFSILVGVVGYWYFKIR